MSDLLTRLSSDLAGDLRALSLSGPRARGALRTATATVAATLVALFLHLDNPWWAGITGVVLIQGDVAATLSRSVDRVIGTTIGAVIGYVGAATIANHVLFLALSASCVGFVIYAQERAERGYAFLLGGITIVLILFGSLADPTNALHLAFFRTFEICIGVITVCAVDAVLAEPADTPIAAPKPGVLTWP